MTLKTRLSCSMERACSSTNSQIKFRSWATWCSSAIFGGVKPYTLRLYCGNCCVAGWISSFLSFCLITNAINIRCCVSTSLASVRIWIFICSYIVLITAVNGVWTFKLLTKSVPKIYKALAIAWVQTFNMMPISA